MFTRSSFVLTYAFTLGFKLALTYTLLFMGCAEEGAPLAPLMVREVQPQRVEQGGVVSLYGWGFGVEGEEDGVWLSGERLEVRFWSERRVDVQLPPNALGALSVVVRARDLVSAPVFVEVVSVALDQREASEHTEGAE